MSELGGVSYNLGEDKNYIKGLWFIYLNRNYSSLGFMTPRNFRVLSVSKEGEHSLGLLGLVFSGGP